MYASDRHNTIDSECDAQHSTWISAFAGMTLRHRGTVETLRIPHIHKPT